MKYPVFLEPGNVDGWLIEAENILGNYFSKVGTIPELKELVNKHTKEGVRHLKPGCFCYVVGTKTLYVLNESYEWVPYGNNDIEKNKKFIDELIENQSTITENDDLINTTWLFNKEIEERPYFSQNVEFISNENIFDGLRTTRDNGMIYFDYMYYHHKSRNEWVKVSTDNHLLEDYWTNDNYRKIKITSNCINPSFFNWLNANALLVKTAAVEYIELKIKGENKSQSIIVEAAKRDELNRIIHYTYATEKDVSAKVQKLKTYLETQINANATRLDEQDSTLTEHTTNISNINDQIDSINRTLATPGEGHSNAEIQQQMAILEDTIEGMLESVGETVANLEETIEDHRSDIDTALGYKTRIDQNTDDIALLKHQMDLVTLQPDDIEELVNATNDAREGLTILEARVSANETNISNNYDSIVSNAAAISALSALVAAKETASINRDNALQQSINTNTSNISKNTNDINILKDRLDNLPNSEQLENVENQIQEFNSRVSTALSSVNSGITEIINTKNSAVDTIENKKTQAVNTINNAIADFEDEIEDIRGYDSRITAVEQRSTSNATDISSLKSRMSAAESTISNHSTLLNNHNNRISTNATDIANLRRDINNLNLTREQLDAIGDYSSTISSLQSQITTNKNNITSIRNQQNINTNDIGILKNKVNDLDILSNQAKDKVDDLENQFLALNITRDDIDGINNSINTLNNNVAAAQSLLSQHTGSIASNSSRIANLQTDLTSLMSRVTTAEGNISTNTTKLGRQEIEIATIKSRFNTYQKKLTPGDNVTIEKDTETGDTVISVDLSALAQNEEVQTELDKKVETSDDLPVDEIIQVESSLIRLANIEDLLGNVKIRLADVESDATESGALYFIKSLNQWRFVQ